MVPSQAQSAGSCSPASRIFSTTIQQPRLGLREPREVALRVGQPVGMVDAQPVDGAVGDRREDLAGGWRRRPPGSSTRKPGQRRHVEEAAVVQLLAADPPVAEPPVLGLEQLGQRQRLGAGRERQHVVVVAQPVARESTSSPAVEALGERASRAPAPAPCRGCRAVPVDVEPAGEAASPARRAAPPTTAGWATPGRRRSCGWARCRGRSPSPAASHAARSRCESLRAAELGVDPAVVDDVVAVPAAGASPAARASSRGGRRRARPGRARRRRRRRSRSPASAAAGRCWSAAAGRGAAGCRHLVLPPQDHDRAGLDLRRVVTAA